MGRLHVGGTLRDSLRGNKNFTELGLGFPA